MADYLITKPTKKVETFGEFGTLLATSQKTANYAIPKNFTEHDEKWWAIGMIVYFGESGEVVQGDLSTAFPYTLIVSNVKDYACSGYERIGGNSGHVNVSENFSHKNITLYANLGINLDYMAKIENASIPIYTGQIFEYNDYIGDDDKIKVGKQLVQLFEDGGGVVPAVEYEYNTSWIQKEVDSGVMKKTFANTHAKAVYTDYKNKKTLDTTLKEINSSIGGKANTNEIPTKVSQLQNDSGYQTKSEVATAVSDGAKNKVDKVDGKGLSTNDFTTAEKNKLANIDDNATATTVDSELSDTSTNPVQNKVVKAELDKKAPTANPVFTGSISMGRDADYSVGENSMAIGNAVSASGKNSFVTGTEAHAKGISSYASGGYCYSNGDYSHSEGYRTSASGKGSHAEGYGTQAASDYQHVQGKCNVEDTESKYAHIVGGGTLKERKNIHTIDWDGNAEYAGDVLCHDQLGFPVRLSWATFSHNIPRPTPKDITSYVADGTLWQRLNGTNGFSLFEDIYVGDYIKMSRPISAKNPDSSQQATGSQYVTIAGIDSLWGNGDNISMEYHHLIMVPGQGFGGTQHFGRAAMNASHATVGGYQSSIMNTKIIGSVVSAGSTADGATINQQLYAEFGSHLKTTRELVSTAINETGYNRFGTNSGCSNNWAWVSMQAILMSEVEVYGSTVWSSSGYDTGSAKMQLPLFANSREAMNNRSSWYWMKDVASASYFCVCNNSGNAGYYYAGSTWYCVRPRFVIAA